MVVLMCLVHFARLEYGRTILEGLTNIAGVRYDSSYGKIFWSQVSLNSPASPGGTKICCCNPDGTEVTEIVTISNFDGIRGFDLDRVNQKIYMVVDRLYLGTNLTYDVKRYNYDGSGEQTLVGGNTYICSPTSLVVNVENNYVFWCDNHGIDEGYIRRCELDGSNYTTIISTNGYARAMCSHDNLLYLGGPGFLSTVEEDGTGQILLSYSGLSVVNSLDVSVADKIYISDSGVNKIFKTDIDGSNLQVLVDDSKARSAICMAAAL